MYYLYLLNPKFHDYLASEAEQAGLNLIWSKIPEDTFLLDVAHMSLSQPKREKDVHLAKTQISLCSHAV